MNEARKPIAFLLVFSFLFLALGCNDDKGMLDVRDIQPSQPPLDGSVELQPRHTHIDLNNRNVALFHTRDDTGHLLQFRVTVEDSLGNATNGGSLHIDRQSSLFAIHYGDGFLNYSPVLLIGNSEDFGNLGAKSGVVLEHKAAFVPLLLVVLALGYAQVNFVINAYRVNMFYLSDALEAGEDYILYCKSWQQLAEFIKYRTLAGLNLVSVFMAIVGAFGTTSTVAAAAETIGMAAAEVIRDDLLSHAIDLWGQTAEQLLASPVGVKVYFDGRPGFSNVWNAYEIIPHYPGCQTGEFRIHGNVRSALTGTGVPGVSVVTSGAGTHSTQTNASGDYTISGLNPGNYIVTYSKAGFITVTRSVTLSGYPVEINIVFTEELGTNEFRLVLEWGASPRDLDAHTWIGSQYHVYYGNMGSLTSPPYVQLDRDDIYGHGPETTTIGQLYDYIRFAVHNFSDDATLAGCGAVVRLYRGNVLYRTYTVPNQGHGRYWYVCDITTNGVLIDRNVIGSTAPGKSAIVEKIKF